MLKDHGTYPKLVNKQELGTLVRLINMSTKGPTSVQVTMMDFSQFLLFIPQLAFLMFSRPPIDKSQYPIVAMLQELMK